MKSKDYFLELKEQEISKMYPSTFTKKEAISTGINLAKSIINGGNVSKHEALANLVRLNEVISNAINELKESVCNEKVKINGVEFNPRSGGSTPNYSEDELWSKLKEKLTDREMLLKVAMKSNDTIYDSEGCEVPRVSENIRKSSLSITY
jgi:hypothetical protein